jgi:type VI secretion system secreted protein Hcp
MAQNFFLKFSDAELNGEVTAEAPSGVKDGIQVLSWSHSFNQPTPPTRSSAGGGTVEQANHADFSITKYIDKASIPLMKVCWNGKTIATATFTACRNDGDTLVDYLQVVMTNVIISNISIGGGTGDLATETVTLSYSKVQYTYQEQKVPGLGTDSGGKKSATHDLNLQKVS